MVLYGMTVDYRKNTVNINMKKEILLLMFSVIEKHYFKSANIFISNSSRIYLNIRQTT